MAFRLCGSEYEPLVDLSRKSGRSRGHTCMVSHQCGHEGDVGDLPPVQTAFRSVCSGNCKGNRARFKISEVFYLVKQ